jgi:hypothetical protein
MDFYDDMEIYETDDLTEMGNQEAWEDAQGEMRSADFDSDDESNYDDGEEVEDGDWDGDEGPIDDDEDPGDGDYWFGRDDCD